jgi:peptidoglycan/LPS O-acetylase OafA/YrhL
MINHFAPQLLPGGYLGVDIFFVISGYVISKALLVNTGLQQIEFFKQFFARRVARLLPALVLCVAISIVLVAMFVQPLSINYWTNAVTGISSSIGLSNMFLVIEQSNYFGSLADFNFFTHTWSLCVEIQFYLLFPFIFLQRSNIGADRRLRRQLLIVTGFSFISFVLFVLLRSVNPTATYYVMPTRFWVQ